MPRYNLQVELDDGAELLAVVDGRDFVAAEAKGWFDSSKEQVTRVRFLAWHCLKRTEKYTGSWEKFNKTDCVDVQAVDPAEDADERLDPGHPDQSGSD